jgi:hypothetical protein
VEDGAVLEADAATVAAAAAAAAAGLIDAKCASIALRTRSSNGKA